MKFEKTKPKPVDALVFVRARVAGFGVDGVARRPGEQSGGAESAAGARRRERQSEPGGAVTNVEMCRVYLDDA